MVQNQKDILNDIETNNIDPLMIQAFEFYLRQKQLKHICVDLVEEYSGNKEVQELSGSVRKLIREFKINRAQELLMQYLYNFDKPEEEQKKNLQIIQNACDFAVEFLENFKHPTFQKMLAGVIQQQTLTPKSFK